MDNQANKKEPQRVRKTPGPSTGFHHGPPPLEQCHLCPFAPPVPYHTNHVTS